MPTSRARFSISDMIHDRDLLRLAVDAVIGDTPVLKFCLTDEAVPAKLPLADDAVPEKLPRKEEAVPGKLP